MSQQCIICSLAQFKPYNPCWWPTVDPVLLADHQPLIQCRVVQWMLPALRSTPSLLDDAAMLPTSRSTSLKGVLAAAHQPLTHCWVMQWMLPALRSTSLDFTPTTL